LAGCDEVAIQEIQNHVHKQSNNLHWCCNASNHMKPNDIQIQHSYQPNETSELTNFC